MKTIQLTHEIFCEQIGCDIAKLSELYATFNEFSKSFYSPIIDFIRLHDGVARVCCDERSDSETLTDMVLDNNEFASKLRQSHFQEYKELSDMTNYSFISKMRAIVDGSYTFEISSEEKLNYLKYADNLKQRLQQFQTLFSDDENQFDKTDIETRLKTYQDRFTDYALGE